MILCGSSKSTIKSNTTPTRGKEERIHIDYAGPFQNHNFLIVVIWNAPITQNTKFVI